ALREFRGVAGGIGRRRRDDLARGAGARQSRVEQRLAGGVGGDGRRAEVDLPLAVAAGVAGRAGEEVEGEGRIRRAGQGAGDGGGRSGGHGGNDGVIREIVRPDVALRVVVDDVAAAAEVNAQAAVVVDRIAAEGIARRGGAGDGDAGATEGGNG